MMDAGREAKQGATHSWRGLPKSPCYENTQKEGNMHISNTLGQFFFPSQIQLRLRIVREEKKKKT